MNTKDRAVAVTITNDGDEPVALQAELFTWNQKPDGADDLQLTDDLILSPRSSSSRPTPSRWCASRAPSPRN